MTKIGYKIDQSNPNTANKTKGDKKHNTNISDPAPPDSASDSESWAATEKLIKLIRINIDKKKKLFLEYSVIFTIRKPCLNLFYLNSSTISK